MMTGKGNIGSLIRPIVIFTLNRISNVRQI
jgi:hypothetical protein